VNFRPSAHENIIESARLDFHELRSCIGAIFKMTDQSFQQEPPSWKEAVRNLILIVITIGVAYIITVYIGLDNLREKVETSGVYAPIIILVLKATTIVVAPLGGTIIYPVAGALFGFWKGTVLCIIGDAIGSSIAFWLSRKFGRSILHYFTSKSQQPMIEKVVERLGEKRSFVKARIFFAGFMDLFAYAAGLSKINFWFFLVIHMGVHAFFVLLYVAFGDLLISGKFGLMFAVSLGSTALAMIGAWLFHLDISKGN